MAYIVIIVHYIRHLLMGNLLGVRQMTLYTVFPWLHISKVFWVTLKLGVYVVNMLLCFSPCLLQSFHMYVCCTFANVFTYLLFPSTFHQDGWDPPQLTLWGPFFSVSGHITKWDSWLAICLGLCVSSVFLAIKWLPFANCEKITTLSFRSVYYHMKRSEVLINM